MRLVRFLAAFAVMLSILGVASLDLRSFGYACDDEPTQHENDMCYRRAARDIGELWICDRINNESIKSDCYAYNAIESGNPIICGNVSDVYQKDYCYYSLAAKLDNSSLCRNVKSIFNRDRCYLDLAKKSGNTSSCENMAGRSDRESCYRMNESTTSTAPSTLPHVSLNTTLRPPPPKTPKAGQATTTSLEPAIPPSKLERQIPALYFVVAALVILIAVVFAYRRRGMGKEKRFFE